MKIAIFIDGSNLYSKLKDLKVKTSQYDYWSFLKNLIKQKEVEYIGYYVGQIQREKRNKKSYILYAKQQKFFKFLKSNIEKIKIIRGHIQNVNGIYKEKGVDVRLALDIYKLGINHTYDKAILISSDSDLIPAIRMVQRRGKMVKHIGFKHKSSIALSRECHEKHLLIKKEIKPFERLK